MTHKTMLKRNRCLPAHFLNSESLTEMPPLLMARGHTQQPHDGQLHRFQVTTRDQLSTPMSPNYFANATNIVGHHPTPGTQCLKSYERQ